MQLLVDLLGSADYPFLLEPTEVEILHAILNPPLSSMQWRKNDSVLDDLIDRFGTGAVVTAQPAMLESGETYRWELKIDGVFVRGVFAKLRSDPRIPTRGCY